MSLPQFAIPGQRLAQTNTHTPGPGTQIINLIDSPQQAHLSATVLGRPTSTKSTSKSTNPSLSVVQTSAQQTRWKPPALPAVGSTVFARVERVTTTNVICSILVLGPSLDVDPNPQSFSKNLQPLTHPFRGILRPPDVRLTQKDTVILAQSFRTGDIIRAVVISLGDQGGYYLSTAGNEFGVVMCWSERGVVCGPASWKEVVEVGEEVEEEERRREPRKVARVW